MKSELPGNIRVKVVAKNISFEISCVNMKALKGKRRL